MKFNIIKNSQDIEYLMKKFAYFHDSCIKELKYLSGGYVNEEGAMYPTNSTRKVSIVFQSQMGEYSAIEIQFEKIKKLNLEPSNEKYDCIISEASIVLIDGLFYWSDWSNFKLEDINKMKSTWISAENIKWRPISNMENDEIYVSNITEVEL